MSAGCSLQPVSQCWARSSRLFACQSHPAEVILIPTAYVSKAIKKRKKRILLMYTLQSKVGPHLQLQSLIPSAWRAGTEPTQGYLAQLSYSQFPLPPPNLVKAR